MKILIFIFLLFVFCSKVSAEDTPCTKDEAIEAEDSASMLNNWEDIYKSFKRFSHCDDGAIAEGYSDSVVRLLAFHWNQLGELVKLSSDRVFFTFVMRHIDATTDESNIEKIIINSSKECPDSASVICSTVNEKARKALREFTE